MSLLGLHRDGDGPLLVWLHGFTQTRNSAHRFRSILAGTFEVVTLDLPGHGANSQVAASLEETADLLAASLPEGPFILAGYSLGARTALHLARRRPERLAGLVLLSGTLGIADEGERAARRRRDEALARRVEALGIESFLDEWLAQPMFASLPADPLERAARSHDAAGLARSLRLAGTGTQSWLGDDLAGVDAPTLVMAGEHDEKFVREAAALAAALPHSHVALVARAGHAAHLEAPDAVAALIARDYPQ